jgi:retron-type reverse transcriptase
MSKKINYVVEADIRLFFDTLNHEKLIEFLEHDIDDKKHIRLIRKFLKAGIMEEGKYIEKEEGSPQGSVMFPVLANVYLHYVLDLWFEKIVKKHCRGEALVR